MVKVLVLFYSLYGHIHKMAEAVAEGINEVEGAEAILRQVPETLSDDVIEKMGGTGSKNKFAHIPVATRKDLENVDGVLFGTPTRFGTMCGQMKQFLDSTGGIWAKRALTGKPGSVFVSTSNQHTGQEATILSVLPTLFHHGMVVVGLPYTFEGQLGTDEVHGGSPYGATTIAGGDGKREPSRVELDGARYQGRHVAEIATKLAR